MQKYMDLLGLKVVDRVTKFRGVVTSVSFDLYGCVQVVVVPEANTAGGKAVDGQWMDWKRLDILDPKPVMARPVFAEPGTEAGPAAKPRR